MIRLDNVNRKAMHELVLYFMQERDAGNTDIQHLVICTEYQFFVFSSSSFERAFFKSSVFRKDFKAWRDNKKTESTTDFFYREIAAPFIEASDVELEAIHLDLRTYRSKIHKGAESKEIVKLFKFLGPHFLLREELNNDSNSLNKAFYDELLHIIGLEERKEGSKRLIGRLSKAKRNPGSLLENAITRIRYEDDFNSPEIILEYGASNEKREFNIALELCLTWINRLLFLKLLEAQLVKFHGHDSSYKFLTRSMIADFDDLSDLFFMVLAFKPDDRPDGVREKYAKIPYLNSSLFELTNLEKRFRINALNNALEIPIFKATVLKDALGRRLSADKNTLGYIFEFLDSYDFGTVGGGDVQEESKTIINAAVLGLIFEKINGYRDGAIFTPGFITMYMARESVEKLVLEAFRREYSSWTLDDIDDLRNNITDRSKSSILKLNEVIDGLTICDPAVGSGHFLVSCLNELIALKSRLGVLADSEGNRLSDYQIEVDNDELIIVHENTDEVFSYQVIENAVPKALQHVQKTLFHEKQKLIENCLFGVDININSVRICQLRLWIELLKNAYYRDGQDGQLETLPNIDINIKCGNAILSRFALDENLSEAFKNAGLTVSTYRALVQEYKNTKDKTTKRHLQERINGAKSRFQEEQLGRLTRKIDAEIAELRAKEAQEDLFSDDEAQKSKRATTISSIRESIEKLESERDKLVQRKTFLSALEWRFEFPEVLDDKGKFLGFDLIIANPPYGVSISEPARSHITRSLGKVPDFEIYYLFLNLAGAICKKEGTTCQIVPNSVLFNHFAKRYREQLLHDWRDIHIDDLTSFRVFEGVVVHNIIFHARRRKGREGVEFRRTGLDTNVLEYLRRDTELASFATLFENNKNWGLVFRLDPQVMETVTKIKSSGTDLKAHFPDISQGLIAYDKHQGQSEEIILSRAFHSNQPTGTNSPWLKGEDVTRFSVQWNGTEYIEYSADLANPRQPKFFNDPRILVREITNPRIFAGYSEETLYNDPALINILDRPNGDFPAFALLAVLNSKVASFYHFNSSPKATKGAFPKILVSDIKSFPLPDIHGKSELIERLVERTKRLCELAKSSKMGMEFRVLDEENEADVVSLYGLSDDEAAIVAEYFLEIRTEDI